MLNARRILKNINKMTQQERIGLHSGRKPWLLDVAVDDNFGHIPREVMFTCLRMYIEQQCKNGYKSFPLWLHDLYNSAGQGMQLRIGKTIDAMDAKKVYQIDNYAVLRLLRDKPKNVIIDVEALINDLDDICCRLENNIEYGRTGLSGVNLDINENWIARGRQRGEGRRVRRQGGRFCRPLLYLKEGEKDDD